MRGENAVHRVDFRNSRVILRDAVQGGLHRHDVAAHGAQAQGVTGVGFDILRLWGVHD